MKRDLLNRDNTAAGGGGARGNGADGGDTGQPKGGRTGGGTGGGTGVGVEGSSMKETPHGSNVEGGEDLTKCDVILRALP